MISRWRSASVWRLVGAMALCGICVWAGCQEPPCRLNAPPQGPSERPHQLQDQYTYMSDNALLAEMSMSPAHFVPGRADLNALGLRRLTRYAELLEIYPGTLNYDGPDPAPLAHERLERIRTFLADAGMDPETIKVERGVAGGQGMRGEEAGAIREFSTFSPQQSGREGKGGSWNDTNSNSN